MEPEMAAFLKKISLSLLATIVWLGITAIAAIKGDNAFVEGDLRPGNIIFYVWLVVSIIILVKMLKRIWKDNDDEAND